MIPGNDSRWLGTDQEGSPTCGGLFWAGIAFVVLLAGLLAAIGTLVGLLTEGL